MDAGGCRAPSLPCQGPPKPTQTTLQTSVISLLCFSGSQMASRATAIMRHLYTTNTQSAHTEMTMFRTRRESFLTFSGELVKHRGHLPAPPPPQQSAWLSVLAESLLCWGPAGLNLTRSGQSCHAPQLLTSPGK